MGPDVAFGVILGRLDYAFHLEGFGDDLGEEAGGVEELEAAAGSAFGEDAGEFVADSLGGDVVDGGGLGGDGGGGGGIDLEVEAGGEADRAEHAELVFGEAEGGVADGSDDSGGEVFAAVDVVEGCGGGIVGLVEEDGVEEHAVDGEVAAEDVLFRRGGEADGVGAAAVRVRAVVAEGGDFGGGLEAVDRLDDEDDAEVGPHGAGLAEEGGDLRRRGGGGYVVVAGGEAEEEVADAAAGEVGLVAGFAEGPGDEEGGLVVGVVMEVAAHVPMIERCAMVVA